MSVTRTFYLADKTLQLPGSKYKPGAGSFFFYLSRRLDVVDYFNGMCEPNYMTLYDKGVRFDIIILKLQIKEFRFFVSPLP